MSVVARRAPNGVEDDLVAVFDYDDCAATLGTSYRAKLPNRACIIGEDAYIDIPNFWRADECRLWVIDDIVDHFDDGRLTQGFNYQMDSVNDDLLAGRTESSIVTLADSLRFQRHMDQMRSSMTVASEKR